MMFELPLVFVSGLLGSSHCIGMCGPFAIAIGAASPSWRQNLARQTIYGVGRTFTYAFLGACAGYGGLALTQRVHAQDSVAAWANVPAVMSLVAGTFLIYQGLLSAGVIRKRGVTEPGGGCLGSSLLSSYLTDQRLGSVFVAGLLTGLLPCGLVYAFLAMAASSGNLPQGMWTMTLFGLGTMPIMIATGYSGTLLSWKSRNRLLRVAAWAVVLAGIVCLVRGIGFLSLPGSEAPPSCPLCV